MNWRSAGALASLILGLALAGCGESNIAVDGPASPGTKAGVAKTPNPGTRPGIAKSATAPSASEPAPSSATLHVPLPAGVANLAANGSFEAWENGAPKGWSLKSGIVSQSHDARIGKSAAQFEPAPSKEAPPATIQRILLHDSSAGRRTLHISMQAKTAEANRLGFCVYGEVGGQVEMVTRNRAGTPAWVNYMGSGEWQTIGASMAVPAGIRANTLRLVIMLRSASKSPALVDDVQAYFE